MARAVCSKVVGLVRRVRTSQAKQAMPGIADTAERRWAMPQQEHDDKITANCSGGGSHSRAGRGFTLLEVVLTLGLVTLALAGLFSFHSHSLETRRWANGRADAMSKRRRALSLITDELRSANISPMLALGMTGSFDPELGGSLRFITAAVPGPGAWVPADADRGEIPIEEDLRLVGYRLRISRDEQGLPLRDEDGIVIVLGLERTCQKLLGAPRVEEGQSFEEAQVVLTELVEPDVRFAMFRFWTGDTYLESWSGGDLPRAVEIILGDSPLDPDQDVEDYLLTHSVARRTVHLPAAYSPDAGAVRGASAGAEARP